MRGSTVGGRAISIGDLFTDVERVVATIDRHHQELVGLMDRIGNNHAWLMTVLAGANPALLQRTNGQLIGARKAVEEACTLLRLSKDNLRGYLRTI